MKCVIKKLTIGVLIAVTLFIMGGCADMSQLEMKLDQQVNDKKDIFLAHMEEKYGMTFLPLSYAGKGYVTAEEFRCYAEGTDPERDYISVFTLEEDGREVIVDDYFGIVIRDEYQKRVDAAADAVAGDAKAYVYRYTVSYFDNALTAENTIDDAIAMGQRISAYKYVFLEVTPGTEADFENTCDRIAEKLKSNKLTGIVVFYGLAQGQLAEISESNYLTYLPGTVKPDGVVCLMKAERRVSQN